LNTLPFIVSLVIGEAGALMRDLSQSEKMFFKARKRETSKVVEKALAKAREAFAKARERMSFDSAGVVAMRQALAELKC
jgi:hypothetical protein